MTRSRLTRPLGRAVLFWLLTLVSSQPAFAQPTATGPAQETPAASAPDSASVPAAGVSATESSSNWPLILGVLGGVALGVLGARMWFRRSSPSLTGESSATLPQPAPAPEPMHRKPAENVPKSPSFQSLRQVQGNPPGSGSLPMPTPKSSGTGGKSKNKPKNPSQPRPPQSWPTNVPRRSSAMNPAPPSVPPMPDDQTLEPGQTIEWTAPTSTPPAIQELIDSTASSDEITIDRDARVESLTALEAAAASMMPNGPVHYYAPAPDVPSIEHRKLSPNPLPQMPLLITLPHAEATTAEFSFSPQADQSRIIGNGVRELKEFFAFELPPTEQFTTIRNLTAGKLEKRDDAWHVVQKAGIALS